MIIAYSPHEHEVYLHSVSSKSVDLGSPEKSSNASGLVGRGRRLLGPKPQAQTLSREPSTPKSDGRECKVSS